MHKAYALPKRQNRLPLRSHRIMPAIARPKPSSISALQPILTLFVIYVRMLLTVSYNASVP